MIETRTVFVLGAGASADFGFPTGLQLRDNIIANLTNEASPEFLQMKDKLGHDPRTILAFVSALRKCPRTPVDAFLESRRFPKQKAKFESIGKKAIAQVLIPHECEDTVTRTQNNWYADLWGHLDTDAIEEFGGNHVTFVTFNYDRSLDHFLYTAIGNRYDLRCRDAIVQTVNYLGVIHLHGQLGYLPWQRRQRPESAERDYVPDASAGAVECGASNIKMVHEVDDHDLAFSKARDRLKDADRIYLLGFGYNQKNVDRLGLLDVDRSRTLVFGTAYKRSPRDRDRLSRRLRERIDLADRNLDVRGFLRNKADLD